MAKKPNIEDFEIKDHELDDIKDLDLSQDQIKHHIRTRRFIRGLENKLVIGGLILTAIAGSSYGIYKCLPEPLKETLHSIPSETYRICSDICQYLNQFPS